VPTGKVTLKELNYARQDVRVTVGILNALKVEFDCHPIDRLPDGVYSPASIFKAYLEKIGVLPPSRKFRLSSRIQGIAAQAYYGGRSEVRVRLAEVPVVHTDFVSEYPTVLILMGIWDFLIAKRLAVKAATREVRRLLAEILKNPESMFERRIWKEFAGYALVEPCNDILPIRTEYKANGDESNIGVNILEHADHPVWFAIPDLVADVLLTGRIPRILNAIRIVPEGKQRGLQCVKLRGKERIDPITGNLYKSLIEAKEREKKQDKDQAYFLKIMANAGYGIFIETTPKRVSRATKVRVFSGEQQFKTKSKIIEDKGTFYCPVIASLITAGGRLLLAILEREVRKAAGTYLFCDTDSMAILAARKSRRVRLTDLENDTQQVVAALSWNSVKQIVNKLKKLNPYAFPGSILKVEKDSLRRQVYGMGVSAKRYCLFDDPGLGVMHMDAPARDSLAFDVMEPVPPLVDAYLLNWIGRETLKRDWFFEERDGNCRLMGSFAIRLSETALTWAHAVAPFAEMVARTLWSTIRKQVRHHRPATRLTQVNRREARAIESAAPAARLSHPESFCRECGVEIWRGGKHCANCANALNTAGLIEAAKKGRIAAQSEAAQTGRSETQLRHRAAMDLWNSADLPVWLNEKYYLTEIQPRLPQVTLSVLASKLAISIPYAVDVRSARRVPHQRHWLTLAELVGIAGK
jgi:hypothetical protein